MKHTLALFALALLSPAAVGQSPYRVGAPAPELRLPDITGEHTLDLADLLGRKVVLFEFASW